MHLITVCDSRLMLLARQNVFSRALQREDMSAVLGTKTGKGHSAPVVAVSPALRRVRLIVLEEGLSQFDATLFQRREKRLDIPDPVLDLNLAHRASLWTLNHRSPTAVTVPHPPSSIRGTCRHNRSGARAVATCATVAEESPILHGGT